MAEGLKDPTRQFVSRDVLRNAMTDGEVDKVVRVLVKNLLGYCETDAVISLVPAVSKVSFVIGRFLRIFIAGQKHVQRYYFCRTICMTLWTFR